MANGFPLEQTDKLKKYLEKRLRGQPKAISSICKTYEYIVTLHDLEQRKGPLGTFLFLGPSGVGKTEMARLLASYFSGTENALIKIPCVGFSQPHMVHSIIGAPHGYIGFDTPPILSKDYIDKKLGSKKADTKPNQMTQVQMEKIVHIKNIRSQGAYLNSLEDLITTNTSLINFLRDYERFLSEPLNDNKSLREILEDKDIRSTIFSLISRDAWEALEQDSTDPLFNTALLIDLYTKTRNMVVTYQNISENFKKNLYQLEELKNVTGKPGLVKIPINEPTESRSIVILFDEIEKSNETLHNLLLEIMEDGKITLANNQVTDLSNAFIVLTGNMGAKKIGNTMKGHKFFGFSGPKKSNASVDDLQDTNLDALEKKILFIAESELEKTFSPEFRGRIDEIIVFRPLSVKDFFDILDYRIELFTDVLLSKDIELTVEQDVRKMVIEQSLHRPEVGARLLNHKLKSMVKIPLGRAMIRNKNFKGRVRAFVKDSKIDFEFK